MKSRLPIHVGGFQIQRMNMAHSPVDRILTDMEYVKFLVKNPKTWGTYSFADPPFSDSPNNVETKPPEKCCIFPNILFCINAVSEDLLFISWLFRYDIPFLDGFTAVMQ